MGKNKNQESVAFGEIEKLEQRLGRGLQCDRSCRVGKIPMFVCLSKNQIHLPTLPYYSPTLASKSRKSGTCGKLFPQQQPQSATYLPRFTHS